MTLLGDIEKYWKNRAEGYSKVNQEELESNQREKWRRTLLSLFPEKKPEETMVLDIGTGPGFFAIILAEAGYRVTAVDYTEEMLKEAQKNAKEQKDKIRWMQMDAQNLKLKEESFDVIVTRNLTWNLENPGKAYKEWHRILKTGGLLLNFDANWYAYLYDDQLKEAYLWDRQRARECDVEDYYEGTDIEEMERIARKVPLSRIQRPKWDLEVMKEIGFRNVSADREIGSVVLSEAEKINYQSTPIFLVRGEK